MKLSEVADVIRSKNAGIHYVTLDVMFRDRGTYETVRDANVITPEVVGEHYDLPTAAVQVYDVPSALAFKATIPREHVAGTLADTDLYGAQQHAPLLDIDIPLEARD